MKALLSLALVSSLFASASPPASWDWGACLPERLRKSQPVTDLGDPFSPPRRPEREAPLVDAKGLPASARLLLDTLAASVRACLTQPRELLLIDRRVFHPGDEIPLPDSSALPGGRILLQRIDAAGAHLTLWLPAEEGPARQQEAVLRAPGKNG